MQGKPIILAISVSICGKNAANEQETSLAA
ncbi:Uncharacterised protein [Vibrio cholerae]|nr:Uncharacterised protein [Vibrio cholerae]